jgi:hypothetical protein
MRLYSIRSRSVPIVMPMKKLEPLYAVADAAKLLNISERRCAD